MLLNNYANTINQAQEQKDIPNTPIDNNSIHKNNSRGLSRLLCLNNNNSNENSDNSCPGNPSFSTILFFILILLILFFFNNNNS